MFNVKTFKADELFIIKIRESIYKGVDKCQENMNY